MECKSIPPNRRCVQLIRLHAVPGPSKDQPSKIECVDDVQKDLVTGVVPENSQEDILSNKMDVVTGTQGYVHSEVSIYVRYIIFFVG